MNGGKSWLGLRLPRTVLTVAALLIAFFAVMPWIHIEPRCFDCEPVDLYGTQIYVVTGLGDGKLVALLALSIVLLRTALIWMARWQLPLLAAITGLALTIMGITAYDTFRDWAGERTLWLYGEVVLSVTVALCGALLLADWARNRAPSPPEAEAMEVTEAWA